jgi:squalene-hopene/tetraprenyl-beta-curcumene cyclase
LPALERAFDWLAEKQVLDVVGDWAGKRPGLRPGGWAFQYENPHYPDVDDTAAAGLALDRFDAERYRGALDRTAEWIIGMQSKDGGWGAFDADNTHFYLNHIPFADHGALLDPPTADVSARCLGFLAQVGYSADHPAVASALDYLRDRAGTGRELVRSLGHQLHLRHLVGAGGAQRRRGQPAAPEIRRAVAWLLARQREDGGWGEGGESYGPEATARHSEYSTVSQTAWAVLADGGGRGGTPGGQTRHRLPHRQPEAGRKLGRAWYTAVGFPRVFYLRYHGYRAYFPLWALARYRRLRQANSPRVAFGI